MYIGRNINTGVFLCLLFFCLTVSLAQTDKETDASKMHSNLKMMERILNTSLSEYNGDVLPIRGVNTSSIYVDGYGIIFTAAPSFNANVLMDIFSRNFVVSSSGYDKKSKEEREKEMQKMREEVLLKFTDPIVEFMADYAAAVRGVKPMDRVTVVCNFPGEYRESIQKMYGKGSNIIYSADKKWLDDFRKGTIGLQDLKTKIVSRIKGFMPETDTIKRVNIFESILEAKLEEMFDKRISSRDINGTYVNGCGAVFSINMGSTEFNFMFHSPSPVFNTGFDEYFFMHPDRNIEDIRDYNIEIKDLDSKLKDLQIKIAGDLEELQKNKLSNEIKVVVTQKEKLNDALKKEEEEKKKVEEEKRLEKEALNKLADFVAGVISDFGLTLREVKDNERIEIFIESARLLGRRHASRDIQFSIRKKDIEDYNKGAINMETFKKRIGIKVFEN